MAVVLPTRQDRPHYTFEATLDGETFEFEFRWGSREACWFMSLYEEDGTPIAVNVKVVIGIPLARRNGKRRPLGNLIARDTSGRNEEARIDDLGTRVQIVYLPEAEAIYV